MNRTCSDLKYTLFVSDGFDRMFSSLWPYVVILCFLSKTSTPLPASKLSGGGRRRRRRRGGRGRDKGGFLLLSSALEFPQRACVQATYSVYSVFCFFQGSSLCGVSLLSNSHRLCRRKGWTFNFIIGFSFFVCFNPAQRPFKLPR